MSIEPAVLENISRTSLRSRTLVLVTAGVFVLQAWLFRPILEDYVPTADDLAVAAASTDAGGPAAPSSWVLDGYRNYFNCDQEWPWVKPTTNFVRPVGNALYWLYYWLFGAHWSAQLVIGYLVHALTVALIFHLALHVLQLSRPSSVAVATIALLNPAYLSRYLDMYTIPWAVQFPVYQFEIVSAFLCVLAVLSFYRRNYVGFGVLATLAVFTKETALTVPVCAFIQLGAWRSTNKLRQLGNAGCILFPLAAWLAVRVFVYRHESAFYVLTAADSSPWARILRNTLLLPTGLYQSPLRQSLQALDEHQWAVVAANGLELLLNAVAWILLAVAGARALKQSGRDWLTRPPSAWVMVLVFGAGNLALACILQSTDVRYCYLWFALGPAALFAGFHSWKYSDALAWGMAGIVLATQSVSMAEALSPAAVADYQLIKRSTKRFTVLLNGLPADTRTVYLFDDLFMRDTSPESTAKLAGFKGRIVRVNNVLPRLNCRPVPAETAHYRVQRELDAMTISYNEPACLYRPQKAIETPLGAIDKGGVLERGPWITYRFPELSIQETPLAGGNHRSYSYGSRWSVRISDPQCKESPKACVLVGLNASTQTYYTITDSAQ